MNILTTYRYYIYPLYVFVALVLILILLRVFKSDVISLVEEEKKIPVITEVVSPMEIRPEFLFFGRVTGKNEIKIVSRLSGKIIYVSEKLFNSYEVRKGEVLFKILSSFTTLAIKSV